MTSTRLCRCLLTGVLVLAAVSFSITPSAKAVPPAWSVLASGTTADLSGVSCPTDGTCVAVGAEGTIMRGTTAGGAMTWSPEDSGTLADLFAVDCLTEETCVAVGHGGTVLKRAVTAGATSWVAQASAAEAARGADLLGVDCSGEPTRGLRLPFLPEVPTLAGDEACFAVGRSVAEGGPATIISTVPVGEGTPAAEIAGRQDTWRSQVAPSVQELYDVSCPTTAQCIAGGTLGVVLGTTDGGVTWVPEDTLTPTAELADLYDQQRLPNRSTGGPNDFDVVTVTCPSGHACIGADRGPHADLAPDVDTDPLPDSGRAGKGSRALRILFGPPNGAWTSGNVAGRIIARGSDCPGTESFDSCHIVGDGGAIARSSNSAFDWSVEPSGVSVDLHDVGCAASVCRAVGDGGTILENRPVPVVTGLSPSGGPTAGGTSVSITGHGLAAVTKVRFGKAEADYVVRSDTEIVAVSPAHPAGPVHIVVSTDSVASAPLAVSRFSYGVAVLDAIAPNVGQSHGGTAVVVKGIGMRQATGVQFGEVAAASFRVESDVELTAVSPPQPNGTVVAVKVTTANGPALAPGNGADRFSYIEGDWSQDRMLEPRAGHTATPLTGPDCQRGSPAPHCGQVLLAGGGSTRPFGGVTAAAELFDPDSGSSTPVGAMREARIHHTATLLPDGRVLVAGGVGDVIAEGRRLPLASVQLYDPRSETWTDAGAMRVPRSHHTAVLLPSGKVLLAGGFGPEPRPVGEEYAGTTPLSSTEVYDPRSNQWAPASSMNAARARHTATVLPNGDVLVAGGAGTPEPSSPLPLLTSAEVYRPTGDGGVGTWRYTGSMADGRSRHTATLVTSEGVVIAAGGQRAAAFSNLASASAEVYSPTAAGKDDDGNSVSGGWARTAPMLSAALDHTATLLANGTVLVAGGCCRHDVPVSSVQLYSPVARQWTAMAPMTTARASATATLLPAGGVLLAGGYDSRRVPSATLEVFGHHEQARPEVLGITPPAGPTNRDSEITVAGTALFPTRSVLVGGKPARIRWSTYRELSVVVPPQAQGAVDVVVETPAGRSVPTPASRFTFGAGAWEPTTGLDEARYQHTATALGDGKVLVAGGTTDFFIPADPEGAHRDSSALYDPATEAWAPTGKMTAPRFDFSATLLKDGSVLVTGGRAGPAGDPSLASAEVYKGGTWMAVEPMRQPRVGHTATLLPDGRVLVAGGAPGEADRGRPSATAELYDPGTKTWLPAAPMTAARANHTATLLSGGRVLVVGGIGASDSITRARALASAEIYDPELKLWTPARDLAVGRFAHTATRLPNGDVLVAGGAVTNARLTNVTEILGADGRGEWRPTGALSQARAGHTATVLKDGKVLVAGSAIPFPNTGFPPVVAVGELYDPVTGAWGYTGPMNVARGMHSATLLENGEVLVVGGSVPGVNVDVSNVERHDPLVSAERYVSAPVVTKLDPAVGPSGGGTRVKISGRDLVEVSGVRFDGQPALSFEARSPTEIVAVSPPRVKGPAQVSVEGLGGTSARLVPTAETLFGYIGPPDQPEGLVATPVSEHEIELRFLAPDDGTTLRGATSYVVKQSEEAITDATFDAATSLCGRICTFEAAREITLRVGDLEPGRTYYYAVKAQGANGDLGVMSRSVSATTFGTTPPQTCLPAVPRGPRELAYEGGRYHLVGLPAGTVVASDSPLYGWFDLGAGGAYSVVEAPHPLEAGRGYWSWSACDRVVTLSGPGSSQESLPLGEYRASMVGNPSGVAAAAVTGHDYVARWDPLANGGAGSYRISGYRQEQSLTVGEGAWVFAYTPTEITIAAQS